MSYYILYPNNHTKNVSVRTSRPNPSTAKKQGYGFAEGPFPTQNAVTIRLNQMNIDTSRRPVKFR